MSEGGVENAQEDLWQIKVMIFKVYYIIGNADIGKVFCKMLEKDSDVYREGYRYIMQL